MPFHYFLGDLAAARRRSEEGLALYDPERDRANAARYGRDVGTACRALLGVTLWAQGLPNEALRHAEEAIAAARAAAHPFSEALALFWAALLHQRRGEVGLCSERAEGALTIATEQVLAIFAAHPMVLSGWALAKKGQAEQGLARLRAGIDAQRAIGEKVLNPHWLALLGEACLEAGRAEEGLSAVREALAEVEETEARFYEAELNRLRGELLLVSGRPHESGAEASFRKAIAIARGQKAKSWELRAATSLARLLTRRGRREEAHALLAPIYGWFTEGFDTADLKDAKALLAELA
jgi:predicted ATPase